MTGPRRAILLALAAPGRITGNAISVARIARNLEARGVAVTQVDAAAPDPDVERALAGAVRAAAAAGGPALIHAYHARKAARFALGAPLPLVVSFGGTDLNQDLDDPAQAPIVRAACARAAALLAHGRGMLETARARLPEHAAKLVLVPKGIAFEGGAGPGFDLRAAAGLGREDLIFFLPAGLRPVKDNAFAFAPLERLRRAEAPALRLVLAGPALDPAYAADVARRAAALPALARLLPPIEPAAMGAAYAASDVVLNTSRSEGYSNAIAEANLAGVPVLAADNPGNRGAVADGVDGLLYRAGDEQDFLAKARALALDPALRARLGAGGRARAERELSPEAEAEAILGAYRGVVG